ncbi:MAG: hypothetical protein PUB00_09910 [Clostridiales bacterium]|nr:hypothetical protein [Clostridiales bacterium]
MDFSVKQNQILRTDADRILTTGNVNSVICHFSFDEGYDGLDVFAVFYRNETLNRMVELVDGSCVIPWEVLEEEGILYVGAYGTKSENNAVVKRLTTNSVAVRVTGDLSSAVLPDAAPTPDEWTAYRTEILGYKQAVETAAATATAKASVAENSAGTAQTAATTAGQKANSAAISAQDAAASKTAANNILSQIIQYAGGVGGSNVISSATQTNLTGLLKGNGEQISAAVAGTDYAAAVHVHSYDTLTGKPDLTAKQDKITSTGILKGNGSGSVTSATAGTDYATPSQVNAKQNTIMASGILKGNGSGTISAATAGTDYLAVTSATTSNGTYLKFNDGTMICYGGKLSKTTDSNGQATITYPVAFYETPAGVATFQAQGSSKQYCNISWSNASSMTVYVISENAALDSTSIYVNYIAIGRWK